MNLEKFTERSRGFLQAAQTIAMRESHQRLLPEHLLKALMDDDQGLASNLIRRAGGEPQRVLRGGRSGAGASCRKVTGDAQPYDGPCAGAGAGRGREDREEGGRQLRSGGTHPDGAGAWCQAKAKDALDAGAVDGAEAERRDQRRPQGPDGGHAPVPKTGYDALKKYARDLTEAAREGKIDPIIGRDEEIRRAMQVLSPPHQEQPGADRRTRRRQDRDCRGPGAAHRQRRRAGKPEEQEADGAGHGRADRRREVSRRVRGAAEGHPERDRRRRRAKSSCSSTRCTRWSARANPKARWMRPT